MKKALTQKRMRELFDYDGLSLIWKKRPESDFLSPQDCAAWNTKFAGKKAGSRHNQGYLQVNLPGGPFLAHRLIFLRERGWLPEQIDHINHNREDNRIENLRPANDRINRRNQSIPKHNTSGRIGVRRAANKWRAAIQVDGRAIYLGYFTDFDEACAARSAAEARFGFHPNHGGRG